MDGKKSLRLPRGCEVTYLAFSLAGWLMGDFYTIVLASALVVRDTGAKLAVRRSVAGKCIRYQLMRNVLQSF